MTTKAGISERWREAACQSADPELFFPVAGARLSRMDTERAKALCIRCAIREQCLDYAVNTGQEHGIWGGMTEEERRLAAARRRRLAGHARA